MKKIYERLVIDMATGVVREEVSRLYAGPLAECKGGVTTNTQDPEYNARMATIYEAQQKMAEEYYNYWQDVYKPLETAQAETNLAMVPQETATYQAGLEKQKLESELQAASLPKTFELASAAMDEKLQGIQLRKPVTAEYYKQATEGPNLSENMNMAEADVKHGFDKSQSASLREVARRGGNVATAITDTSLARAKSIAGARTEARRTTTDQAFARLSDAMSRGVS